ncbi:alpha/beta fold hydrolase [Nakamurella lactea]|uniref:alpha/beta fold hydrolase n=1 Tax=Nakamurella lactea TaxID=459515 RepID=UPI0004214E46|nr:alpha/beta fold hydrolase [Nakamurella lactea]
MHVEPQVFDVLLYLVQNRDRVVSKPELLEAVWGSRYVSDSALTSRLKVARRAVGDDGRRQQLITTVHGVGYRFAADVTESGPPAPDQQPVRHRTAQQIRYCRSPDDVRIAYATSGVGPPLVKAANWLTHVDLEWDSPIWAHWIEELSSAHQLIRYDERGCGLSDWDVREFSLDAWVEDLEMVVDAVGLERFPLLGISQGGAVAVSYAVRHPTKVSRLVLAGAYARGRLARAATPSEREEADLDLRVGRIAWERDDPGYRQVFAAQFLPEAPREAWDDFNRLQRATTSTANIARFLDAFARIDVSDIARNVACPTLILHARRDRRVPMAQALELAALIPGSELRLLDTGNHIVTRFEPAWSDLVEQLNDFLLADGS